MSAKLCEDWNVMIEHEQTARRFLAIVLLGLMMCVLPASAKDDRGGAERAQGLLQRAVENYREQGDLSFATFSRQGPFIDGELYVYVVGVDGRLLASGGSSASLIGQNVAETLVDGEGNPFIRKMLDIAAAQGKGQIEYRWLNRVYGEIERKVTFFEQVGDRVLAVGYYLPYGTREQAAALLERAANAVERDAEAAFVRFNDRFGSFVEDDLYVFVIDLDTGRFRAHGTMPRLIGKPSEGLQDGNGEVFVPRMFQAVKDGDRGEVTYAWKNPKTGLTLVKHSLLRKISRHLVGVGYYEPDGQDR